MEIMGNYGPIDHMGSWIFIDELSLRIAQCSLPIVMGGDFNLMPCTNTRIMCLLTRPVLICSTRTSPMGLPRDSSIGGEVYWTNRELNPLWCVLDWVFISAELDAKFPLCLLVAETSLWSLTQERDSKFVVIIVSSRSGWLRWRLPQSVLWQLG